MQLVYPGGSAAGSRQGSQYAPGQIQQPTAEYQQLPPGLVQGVPAHHEAANMPASGDASQYYPSLSGL